MVWIIWQEHAWTTGSLTRLSRRKTNRQEALKQSAEVTQKQHSRKTKQGTPAVSC